MRRTPQGALRAETRANVGRPARLPNAVLIRSFEQRTGRLRRMEQPHR